MIDLQHAHWFPLASQGNIYSLTTLYSLKNANKILVSSLKRKIYSFEYQQHSKCILKPLIKELVFTYIPTGAEIISIDAYNKSNNGDEFVIGITIMKPSGESSIERYLNIYTEGVGDGEENNSIESIAQNCLMVELPYTPHLLYHTVIPHPESNEVVWLISGDDNKIHMIREDKQNHSYMESLVEKYFPELDHLETVALWLDVHYDKDFKWRFTGVGCECGLFKLSKVNVETLEVTKSWMLRYNNPVCSVKIFCMKNNIQKPEFLKFRYDGAAEDKINVLITTGTSAVVFQDIENQLLKDNVTINDTMSGTILCSCIADINMDGKNEILLGTYKQELLVFNFEENAWKLIEKKTFDAPIHSMCYIDIVGDGVKALVVLTQKSVHIMQHNVKDTIALWKQRFLKLTSTINKI